MIVRALLSLVVVLVVLSCGSPEGKRAQAASTYAGQQADCIASNKTREAIDACRDKVKAAWSNDAGVEGGSK